MKNIFAGIMLGASAAVFIPAVAVADDQKSDDAKLVSGNNSFALRFYKEMASRKGNIFISPASISSALAMTYAGARGETAEQMRKALSFSLPDPELHVAFKTFLAKLNESNNDYELSIANSLWPQAGYKFKDEFIELLKTNYGAEPRAVDYSNPAKACEIVNKWVEEKTKEKIKNLLSAPPVDELTRLILVNAIYFKGKWETEFDKKKTIESQFFTSEDSTVKCQMMNGKIEGLPHFGDENLQALELPYKGGLSMLLILPKEKGSLPKIEALLDFAKFADIRRNLRKKEVQVSIPKFRTTVSATLNDYFKKLGMIDAFTSKADFSAMDGTDSLYISAILHKAFVDVNEEGSEAAAATAVIMRLKCAPEPLPVFRADSPFLFFICGKDGEILFMGRICDPTQEENKL